MLQLNPYLLFDGTCAEAMRFYERALGAKLEAMMAQSESPMRSPTPTGKESLILHARLVKGDFVLMASDYMLDAPYPGMSGFSLSLTYSSVDEARKVFDALALEGEMTMPMQKTFWSEIFGMLRDRFGTPWMINVNLSEPTAK